MELPVGVTLVAAVAAFTLPLGVAVALGTFEGGPANVDAEDPYVAGHGPHEGGYNTNRQEVARGGSPLGEWRMHSSSGPEGVCVEIELPDRNPPGGGRAFYSECSERGDLSLNPSTIAAEQGAIVFGLGPPEARRVSLAGEDAEAVLRPAATGDHTLFVGVTADPQPDGAVAAIGPDGRPIAARAIP